VYISRPVAERGPKVPEVIRQIEEGFDVLARRAAAPRATPRAGAAAEAGTL
jgi:hypothetical protein